MIKAFSTTFYALLIGIITLSFTNCDTKAQAIKYEMNNLTTDLEVVWDIVWGSDDFLWVTERPGRVQRINPETGGKQLVLDITGDVATGSEQGLMGMAHSPSFTKDKFVFLSYTYNVGKSVKVKIVRYKYNGKILVEPMTLIDDIQGAGIHDGCRLEFDDDGKLFITTGDAGNTKSPQDLASINGKVLRVNPDGTIPTDNPFYGTKSKRNEIWTFGHRNPQGLVFHNGILYSSEHGPNTNDELNIIEKARNYGWPDVEGFCDTKEEMAFCEENKVREPAAVYYEKNTLAVAGIDYYDVNAKAKHYNPEWQNSILMTTLKSGLLKQVILSKDGTQVIGEQDIISNDYGRLRSVCVAPDGRVFVGTSNRDGRGSIRKGDDKIIEIKLATPSSVETEDSGSLINIFPNPSYGSLNLKSESTTNSSIKIFDSMGKVINSLDLSPMQSLVVDLKAYSSGRYNFQIENEGKLINKFVNIIH